MARLNVRDYLKDIHKGQDIYVIASGASMDYVDPSFFEGKIKNIDVMILLACFVEIVTKLVNLKII